MVGASVAQSVTYEFFENAGKALGASGGWSGLGEHRIEAPQGASRTRKLRSVYGNAGPRVSRRRDALPIALVAVIHGVRIQLVKSALVLLARLTYLMLSLLSGCPE